MADLGVLSVGTYTSSDGQISVVGTPPYLQVIGSANDSIYVYDNANTTHTAVADFELSDTPVNLGTMDSLSIRLRYHRNANDPLKTWDTLQVRIFRSDGVTPLTNAATVASNITTTTPTNSAVITFTGLDTTADRTVWEGATVRLSWTVTKTKGGNSDELRVTAGELTGTYTAFVATVERTGSISSTSELTGTVQKISIRTGAVVSNSALTADGAKVVNVVEATGNISGTSSLSGTGQTLSEWTTFSDGVSSSTGATVTGLTNGVGYEFRVAAVNSAGQGEWSNVAGPYTPASGEEVGVLKRWDGSSWVAAIVKFGSGWQPVYWKVPT